MNQHNVMIFFRRSFSLRRFTVKRKLNWTKFEVNFETFKMNKFVHACSRRASRRIIKLRYFFVFFFELKTIETKTDLSCLNNVQNTWNIEQWRWTCEVTINFEDIKLRYNSINVAKWQNFVGSFASKSSHSRFIFCRFDCSHLIFSCVCMCLNMFVDNMR